MLHLHGKCLVDVLLIAYHFRNRRASVQAVLGLPPVEANHGIIAQTRPLFLQYQIAGTFFETDESVFVPEKAYDIGCLLCRRIGVFTEIVVIRTAVGVLFIRHYKCGLGFGHSTFFGFRA